MTAGIIAISLLAVAGYFTVGAIVLDLLFEEAEHDLPKWAFLPMIAVWPIRIGFFVVAISYQSFCDRRRNS